MQMTAAAGQPIRKSAQRLRWFVRAFEDRAAAEEAATGHRFEVDRAALARVFADWLADFQSQKPEADEVKPAYVGFAAGLMLRALIEGAPARVAERGPLPQDDPAGFWPEGHLYVGFCLDVRGQVIAADFHGAQRLAPALEDVRTWWSFRENAIEDPSRAIGFLDLFAGEEPDWSAPRLFRPRTAPPALGARPAPPHVQPVD